MADCVDILRKGVAQGMSDDEITALLEKVKKTRRKLAQSNRRVDDMEAALVQEVAKQGERDTLEALYRKRALALQATKRARAVDYVLSNFQGQEYEGLSSLLVGSNLARDGTRFSVDAQTTSLTGYYVGGLLSDLEALDGAHLALFKKGSMDEPVARALFSLDNPDAPRFEGPDQAMEIAQVIRKWQEKARSDQNRAGAWIGSLPGYIVRQSHDPSKLRRAGFEKWRDAIKPLLDMEKTADGAWDNGESPDDFLHEVYKNLVSGVRPHERPVSLLRTSTVGSTAARVSQERVLHFKDGAAWFQYNKEFGRGSLREALLDGLQKAASTTALMRVLGPSPQANFDAVYDAILQHLHERGDIDGMERFKKARRPLTNQLKEVDGTLNLGGDPHLATVGRVVRALQSMGKLGGAVISAITDIPTAASEFAWQGKGFFLPMLRGMQLMVKGRGTREQRRILSSLGVFSETMSGDLIARFSGEELPGRMTRLQNLFFKASGLSWWTESWRKAAGLMLSHDLALEKDLAWDALSKKRRRVLAMYGIDGERWDIIRSGETRAADGRDYLTPDALDDVPPDVLAAYLMHKGLEPTEGRIADLRFELQSQLRTYFHDRIDFAVLQPDAKTRSITRQGTSSGTIPGELLRFVMQFKSFPVAMLQKVWGRELGGRGATSAWKGFFNQNGELANLARLFLMQTLFGYIAMTAKELLKGRNPREIDSLEMAYKTFLAAALQGGGLGIFGDFMFGEANRAGGGLVATLAGPTLGTIDEIHDIWVRVRDGDTLGQGALRTIMGLVPGNNLWWFRWAFDWMVGYQLFEMINPGYYRRMKRRVERENNQTLWMRPWGVAG